MFSAGEVRPGPDVLGESADVLREDYLISSNEEEEEEEDGDGDGDGSSSKFVGTLRMVHTCMRVKCCLSVVIATVVVKQGVIPWLLEMRTLNLKRRSLQHHPWASPTQ